METKVDGMSSRHRLPSQGPAKTLLEPDRSTDRSSATTTAISARYSDGRSLSFSEVRRRWRDNRDQFADRIIDLLQRDPALAERFRGYFYQDPAAGERWVSAVRWGLVRATLGKDLKELAPEVQAELTRQIFSDIEDAVTPGSQVSTLDRLDPPRRRIPGGVSTELGPGERSDNGDRGNGRDADKAKDESDDEGRDGADDSAAVQSVTERETTSRSRQVENRDEVTRTAAQARAPVFVDDYRSNNIEMPPMTSAFNNSQVSIQSIPNSMGITTMTSQFGAMQSPSPPAAASPWATPSSSSPQSSLGRAGFLGTPVLNVRICVAINLVMALAVLASLVLGLVWSIVKNDVQGGFTMAAYIVGTASLVAYTVNKAHKKNCRCYLPVHGV